MSFEELYEKVAAGTATPEEVREMEEKMRMLKMMASILDRPEEGEQPAPAPVLAEADPAMIKKARKKVKARIVLTVIFGSIAAVAAITGAVFWFIFGNAHKSATKNMQYSKEQCIDLAEQCIEEYRGTSVEKAMLNDIDRHYDMGGGIFNADFIYEVEIATGNTEYEVRVNASNGYAIMTHVRTED